jgi:ribonuclease HII
MPDADFVIVDGNFIPELIHIPAQSVIGGDALSLSIAAASIVAKVTRDGWVKAAAEKFPIYGWEKNKGYGTKDHMASIRLYGPCMFHRKTFGGVKEYA